MRTNLLPLGCLLLSLLGTSSCGKEAKSKQNEGQTLQVYQNELNHSALEQLLVAFRDNNNSEFKQIVFQFKIHDLLDSHLEIKGETSDKFVGDTFLTLAIKNNNRELFEFLLKEKDVDPEKVSHHVSTFGLSPLILAVIYDRPQMVLTLLEKKARIDRLDENGRTALHHAIQRRRDEIAILLIKQNANIHILDRQGRNAYTLALEVGSETIIDYLHGITQFHQGLIPDSQTVKGLIQMGDARMLSRIFYRYPDLVEKYASIDPVNLAIDIADDNQSFLTTQTLLIHGFTPNAINGGQAPLTKAILKNRTLVAELLLQKGADVNNQDESGYSALYYAIQSNLPEMVDLLRSFNAEIYYRIRQSDGKRYVFRACREAVVVGKTFTEQVDMENNMTIKRRLECL